MVRSKKKNVSIWFPSRILTAARVARRPRGLQARHRAWGEKMEEMCSKFGEGRQDCINSKFPEVDGKVV